MAEGPRTFSESWHRVAGQRIHLRTGVEIQRHRFRGERWMVLQDPLSNQFFRLRPEAYEFVARLRPDKTVEEVWQECLDLFPQTAPGQEAIVNLLAQLYHGGLLHYELAPDTEQLFERYKKRRRAELGFRWLNIMFMRFPLLDPDRFLVRTLPLVGKLISPFGTLLWLVVMGLGIKVAMENFPALRDQSQGALDPGNLVWLYAGLVIVKTLHEFGHAYFCRFFGGEVHQMGVMLMIFTPVPYMDATSSWGFRKKRHRILVGLAGMIVEFFVAACAAMVWAHTAPGVVHSVTFNIMFVASVSTLLFNINPLMRFDGYYILSDWLEIPNLNQRSTGQLRYLAERFLLGVKAAQSQAHSKTEAGWLVVFGISALIYRTIVFAGIVWFISDKWLLLGMAMAAACVIAWVLTPLVKLTHYLASSPKLDRNRPRAIAVVAACAAVILGFLALVPLPYHFRASGVLQARQWSQLITEAEGEVAGILAKPGQRVTAGQPLVRLENQELAFRLAEARAIYEEVEARWRAAVQRDTAGLKPLAARRESAKLLIERLEADQKNLIVRARHEGVWVAPGVEDFHKRWLKRGTPVGLVIDPKSFEFSATVLQEDVDRIFRRHFEDTEVRLFGQVGDVLQITKLRIVPGEQRVLPSPALGWMAGGDVATSLTDKEGRTAREPFFSVIGRVSVSDGAALLHGRTGKIRFRLDDQPLLPRWIRRLSQLMQKRFQF